MLLIDANVVMYAAGKDHPFKAPSQQLLARVATGEVVAAIDAEALQEILHRYQAMGRWSDARRVYDLTRVAIGTVLPITAEVMGRARQILDAAPTASVRDAVHAAVAQGAGARICSYDKGFDRLPGCVRVEP